MEKESGARRREGGGDIFITSRAKLADRPLRPDRPGQARPHQGTTGDPLTAAAVTVTAGGAAWKGSSNTSGTSNVINVMIIGRKKLERSTFWGVLRGGECKLRRQYYEPSKKFGIR